MCVLEIRDAGDIDLVVSKEVFNGYDNDPNWQRKYFDDGGYWLFNGDFELGTFWDSSESKPNLAELKSTENVVDEVPFVSLNRLLNWKNKNGRPKDLKDVGLIKIFKKNKSLTDGI